VKSKFAVVMFLSVLAGGIARAAGPIKVIRVWMDCSGQDIIGGRLCSAVKEKIRASRGFELVDRLTAEISLSGYAMHLVTINVDRGGYGANLAGCGKTSIPH